METKFDITKFRPCVNGLRYYESHDTFEDFWSACHRGDWMLWLAAHLCVDDRLLTKAKALCANTVRHLMRDERSAAAVNAALWYADGKISRAQLMEHAAMARLAECLAYADRTVKATAALAAAYATLADATAHAAHAAADANAAHAVHAAAHAAFAAAYAATFSDGSVAAAGAADAAAYAAATSTAADADADAARRANQLQTANICREILTDAVLAKVNQVI